LLAPRPLLDGGGSRPATSDPDAALVRACQALGPGACKAEFQQLYERHRNRVFRTCFRLTGNEADALDAAQETFRTVYHRIDRFNFRSRFSTWLFRVASNTSLDVRASSRRRQMQSLEALLDGPTAAVLEPRDKRAVNPLQRASHSELQEGIQQALLRLSPKYRQVIVLRYLEGLTYPEMSEVLEVSLGTVKSRMARAHVALDRVIAPLLERFVA